MGVWGSNSVFARSHAPNCKHRRPESTARLCALNRRVLLRFICVSWRVIAPNIRRETVRAKSGVFRPKLAGRNLGQPNWFLRFRRPETAMNREKPGGAPAETLTERIESVGWHKGLLTYQQKDVPNNRGEVALPGRGGGRPRPPAQQQQRRSTGGNGG